MRRSFLMLTVAGLLAACQGEAPPPAQAPPLTPPAKPAASGPAVEPQPDAAGASDPRVGLQGGVGDWRQVATAEDASRLSRIEDAWLLGRAEAEEKGFASEVETLGSLVDPNAALPGRLQPSPGDYRCRTIKIGSHNGQGLGYVSYPWFRCTIELTVGGDLILTKTTGSQRTQGLLYPDTDRRLVFVGAQAWGAMETGYPGYGDQPERDQIGVLERIADQRWRLVLPWPKQEAKLEILELRR